MQNTTIATVTQDEPAILKWVVNRDDVDHAAILQAIERSNHLSNWQMGYIDAHEGAAFVPEMYFLNNRPRSLEYANGYITCRPDCEAARIFVAKREQATPQLELFVVAQPEEEPPWMNQELDEEEEPTEVQMWYYYEHGAEGMLEEEDRLEYEMQMNDQRYPLWS